jgi:hypothetical protein
MALEYYPISLLVKQPHSSEWLPGCLLDSDAYNRLIDEGWNLSVGVPQRDCLYVRIHRQRNGRREWHNLHRWLAFAGQINPGHKIEIHHVNMLTTDNQTSNLAVLPNKQHRALHPKRKGVSNGLK